LVTGVFITATPTVKTIATIVTIKATPTKKIQTITTLITIILSTISRPRQHPRELLQPSITINRAINKVLINHCQSFFQFFTHIL
jgi:hypothetical protein